MSASTLSPNTVESFELFIDSPICRGEDLYLLDGETAFRRRGGCIETFDAGYAPFFRGGQP